MWAILVLVGAVAAMLVRWRFTKDSLLDFFGMGLIHGYAKLWHGWQGAMAEPIPDKGPVIVISNHTSSSDPTFLTAAFSRPPGFLQAEEYDFRVLKPLWDYIGCVPIRRNQPDPVAVRQTLRRLEEGRLLCLFPEGTLAGTGRNRVRPGKGGAAYFALRSKAPVFPAYISKGPQTINLPMAWFWPSRVCVTFGRPIDLSAYYDRPINRKLIEEVTMLLMKQIAALEPNPRSAVRGL